MPDLPDPSNPTAPQPSPTPTPPPQPLPQPHPVPTPPQPTFPPPGPATPPPGPGNPSVPPPGQPASPSAGDDLPYFQEGVPWRQLPPDQQLAYWMHRSRKHESRVQSMSDYDQLRADSQRYQELLTQTQTAQERAIAEARRQGETEAMQRANHMLVEAYVRSAAAARGVEADVVSDLLETLDRSKFVGANGQVDTARVYGLVNRMSPANPAAAPTQAPAAVPAPPTVAAPQAIPGAPQSYPQGWPGQQPQQQPGVPAAPQWPAGQVPAAPAAPTGVPGQPDFGQGVYRQAPPSRFEAGRAAARARFQKNTPQATQTA